MTSYDVAVYDHATHIETIKDLTTVQMKVLSRIMTRRGRALTFKIIRPIRRPPPHCHLCGVMLTRSFDPEKRLYHTWLYHPDILADYGGNLVDKLVRGG